MIIEGEKIYDIPSESYIILNVVLCKKCINKMYKQIKKKTKSVHSVGLNLGSGFFQVRLEDGPRVETKRQARRGTVMWKHRRGLYVACPKRRGKGKFYARFYPFLRGVKKCLVNKNCQLLGEFWSVGKTMERLEKHLQKTNDKPLIRPVPFLNYWQWKKQK